MGRILNNVHFHFTAASILAVVSAIVAVAVSFGLHVSHDQEQALLILVGLLGAGVTIGGGIKSAALFRTGDHPAQHRRSTSHRRRE